MKLNVQAVVTLPCRTSFFQKYRKSKKYRVFHILWKTLYFLAPQRGFEPPTYRLGVDPIRHREVTSNA